MAMVEFDSRLVELYHYLVSSAYEGVVQTCHLLERYNWSRHRSVDVSHYLIHLVFEEVVACRNICKLHRHRVLLIAHFAFGIQIDFLTVYVWCQDYLVFLIALLMVEA